VRSTTMVPLVFLCLNANFLLGPGPGPRDIKGAGK
jgi:hypothetical protein